jgi:hypothetical protein
MRRREIARGVVSTLGLSGLAVFFVSAFSTAMDLVWDNAISEGRVAAIITLSAVAVSVLSGGLVWLLKEED